MPSSRQERMTRTAISPRLAIRIFRMGLGPWATSVRLARASERRRVAEGPGSRRPALASSRTRWTWGTGDGHESNCVAMGGDGSPGGRGGALAGGLGGANFKRVRDHGRGDLGERTAEHIDAGGRQRRRADGDRNRWVDG